MTNNIKLHHYTNIDTLALILKHKKIRFNRLDRVDDISESKPHGSFYIANKLFVSCWTDDDEESIPLWHMYTNKMKGVRITLNKDFFDYQPLKPSPEFNVKPFGEISSISEMLSPIPFDDCYTEKYLIHPFFLNSKDFEKKVEYVENPSEYQENSIKCIASDIISSDPITGEKRVNVNLKIGSISKIACYKKKVWQFQNEFRFVLLIVPGVPLILDGNTNEKYIKLMIESTMQSFINGTGPDINFFDVKISDKAINDIIVTTGPNCSEGDKVIVKSLLEKYTLNGKHTESKLEGDIRF